MQRHTISKSKAHTKSTRVGRGGTRGKTSGRGHKGQKARAGHKLRPQERDIIKKLPKRRGHGKNRARGVNPDRPTPVGVPINRLEHVFANGDTINPQVLVERDVISSRAGKIPKVKLVGTTGLTKKLSVSDCLVTEGARKAITDAGGSVS